MDKINPIEGVLTAALNELKAQGEATRAVQKFPGTMSFSDFDRHFEDLVEEIRGLSGSKGKEYANGADRFGNFNRLQSRIGIDAPRVCYTFLTKHLDGIEQYLKTGEVYSEAIHGRICDAMLYLALLDGLLAVAPKKRKESQVLEVGIFLISEQLPGQWILYDPSKDTTDTFDSMQEAVSDAATRIALAERKGKDSDPRIGRKR